MPDPCQLWLFDCPPDALAELEREKVRLTASARSENTRASYASDWKMFCRWSACHHLEPLPVDAQNLAYYLSDLIRSGISVASAARRSSAIAHVHLAAGFPSPISTESRAVLSGARRLYGEGARRKSALTLEQMRAICGLFTQSRNRDIRDRALLLLGFASGCRRSELRALDLEDVAFRDRGLILTIRRAKTDQYGAGRQLAIWHGREEATCPVVALRRWMMVRGDLPGPLFSMISWADRIKIRRMAEETVCLVVQRAAQAIGLDPREYGGHSLRAACVTAAVENGAQDLAIMCRTGHKSLASVKRYIRSVDPFAGVDVMAGIL